MRVAIVGAFGQTGPALIEHLPPEYDLTLVDVADHPDHETVVADAADPEELAPALADHDAVVLLARAPYDGADDVEGLCDNLRMIHATLAAARDHGLETVVFASTNHVVGTYEDAFAPDVYYPGHEVTIDHTVPVRPDSLYAVGKACGEALGRFVVDHERYPEQFFALRIGTVRPAEQDHPYCQAEAGVDRNDWERDSVEYRRQAARTKATWQSRWDFAHLVESCVETSGAGFDVFYGVSDNDRRFWDVDHAREMIGYDPRDNAEAWTEPPVKE